MTTPTGRRVLRPRSLRQPSAPGASPDVPAASKTPLPGPEPPHPPAIITPPAPDYPPMQDPGFKVLNHLQPTMQRDRPPPAGRGEQGEVVRHGLRLLEEAEHRRLLEKWIFEGLTEEERDRIPPAILVRARAHFREIADTALREVGDGRVADGPVAMERLRERIEART